MSDGMFRLPTHPVSISKWEDLPSNERDWIEFLRIISCGGDPAVTPERVRRLADLLDETR